MKPVYFGRSYGKKVNTKEAGDNYFTFGALLPGRSYNSGDYKYSYNSKEQDPEISGTGNSYDYGFRIYNPRLGRFLSVDPLTKDYPELTPYQFSGNTPIWAIDIDGLEPGYTNKGTQTPDNDGYPTTTPSSSTNTNSTSEHTYHVTPTNSSSTTSLGTTPTTNTPAPSKSGYQQFLSIGRQMDQFLMGSEPYKKPVNTKTDPITGELHGFEQTTGNGPGENYFKGDPHFQTQERNAGDIAGGASKGKMINSKSTFKTMKDFAIQGKYELVASMANSIDQSAAFHSALIGRPYAFEESPIIPKTLKMTIFITDMTLAPNLTTYGLKDTIVLEKDKKNVNTRRILR